MRQHSVHNSLLWTVQVRAIPRFLSRKANLRSTITGFIRCVIVWLPVWSQVYDWVCEGVCEFLSNQASSSGKLCFDNRFISCVTDLPSKLSNTFVQVLSKLIEILPLNFTAIWAFLHTMKGFRAEKNDSTVHKTLLVMCAPLWPIVAIINVCYTFLNFYNCSFFCLKSNMKQARGEQWDLCPRER